VNTFVRRAAALVAAPALATAALVATSGAPAQAAVTTPPTPAATAAAAWLDGKLVNGLLDADPAQAGSTIDLALSLVASGTSPATVAKVRAGLDSVLDEYTAEGPGATAKAAHFYEAIGVGASDELVQQLEDAVDDSTGELGSVYDQVWAVQALREAGSDEIGTATEFLVDQRCDGGGWGYLAPACTSDVDATAWAVLALLPRATEPDVKAAVDAGLTWLRSVQFADGGFGWNPADATSANANSTGLAGWALGAAGQTDPAARAASWVASRQVVALPACGVTKADAENGAIAPDQTGLDTARQQGLAAEDLATWKRAGAQALAALAYLPSSAPTLGAPAGYVRAGSTVAVTVAGLRAGEVACLSGVGTPARVTGPGTVPVTLPAATADHALTLTTVGKPITVTVEALGKATLKLKLDKKLKKGQKQKVTVTGLAPREKVAVRVGGKKVDAGKANAKGVFTAAFKATGKPGKRVVKVAGQFADRSGKATFKVVR
jgi:hypothetical protein